MDVSLPLKKTLIDMAGLGWAPPRQGPSPPAKVPPVPGRECGVLGRSLESKGEIGEMESELERDLEGGRRKGV